MKRRELIGGLAATSVLATSVLGSRTARAAETLDPSDPVDVGTMYRKLSYSLDDRPVYWYLQCVRYGLRDSEFTPFWTMNVAFISRTTDDGGGDFTSHILSSIYYTDLETDEILEAFDNPYTGKTIPVRQPGVIFSKRHYSATGMKSEREAPSEGTFKEFGDFGPAWAIGDDLWVRGDTGFRLEPPAGSDRPLVQINDWTTFHGSLAEVSDPGVISAEATQTFNDINTFPAWLEMGGIAGNYVSRGFGRKGYSADMMPRRWREIMQERHPDIAENPAGAITLD